MEITDKQIVIITGGAGKLGLLAADWCLSKGARVVLIDHNKLSLTAAKKKLGNSKLDCIVADVTRTDDTKRYVNEIERKFGKIDIYIHCVGTQALLRPVVEIPEQDFLFNKHLSFTGIWLACQYVLPAINKGGQFFIISSNPRRRKPIDEDTPFEDKQQVNALVKTFSMVSDARSIRMHTVEPSEFEGVLLPVTMNF